MIISKCQNPDFNFVLYPDGDPDQSQNLMDLYPVFFQEVPTISI